MVPRERMMLKRKPAPGVAKAVNAAKQVITTQKRRILVRAEIKLNGTLSPRIVFSFLPSECQLRILFALSQVNAPSLNSFWTISEFTEVFNFLVDCRSRSRVPA